MFRRLAKVFACGLVVLGWFLQPVLPVVASDAVEYGKSSSSSIENAGGLIENDDSNSGVCADNVESVSLTPSLVEGVNEGLNQLRDKNLLTDELNSAVLKKDFTVLDGANEGSFSHVQVIIANKNFLITTTRDNPNIVSLVETNIGPDGTVSRSDVLLTDNRSGANEDSVTPAGYYGTSCVKWNTTCLKNFVKNGCNSGICSFVAWNPYLTAGCLFLHCGVGVNNCCSKWGDGYWHEW